MHTKAQEDSFYLIKILDFFVTTRIQGLIIIKFIVFFSCIDYFHFNYHAIVHGKHNGCKKNVAFSFDLTNVSF